MNTPFNPIPRTATSKEFGAFYPTNINSYVTSALRKAHDDNTRLYYDTSIGHMAVDSLTDYVIGSGLVPTASPERMLIGWTDEQRRTFCSQAEAYWRLVTGSDDFDFYGKNNFKSLQKIAFKNILIKGDVLLHLYYRDRKSDYKPAVQILSGQWVRNPSSQLTDTQKLAGGVAFDSSSREIGYYIAKVDENLNDTRESHYVSKYNRAGMKEFDLIKLAVSEANQVRGIPLLTPCKDDILNLEVTKTNFITKFLVESLLTVFIKTAEDSVASNETLETIKSLGSQFSDAYEEDREITLFPGNVIQLQPGESTETVQPTQSSHTYTELEKTILSSIGGAIGVPYEMLLKQYNSSYSASRATIMSASKHFAEIREEFAGKFCQEVYEMVIDYGIRRGIIEAPGYLDGSDDYKSAILACTWIGPTPVIMDPVKEANSQKLMIEANLTTMERAVRDLSGMDFEEVIERRAYEIEYINELLAPLIPVPQEEETSAPSDSNQDSKEEDKEEKDSE